MNILTEPLPTHIEISGEKYPINTDFRTWIKFEELFLDTKIPAPERLVRAIELCFDFKKQKKFPKKAKETAEALLGFYSCNSRAKPSGKKSAPLYSFSEDGGYIYAAFLAQYGIDLTTALIHWWQFCALFSSLDDKQKICEIMRIRSTDLLKIKNPEQRKQLRRLKNIYSLGKKAEIDIAGELEKAF